MSYTATVTTTVGISGLNPIAGVGTRTADGIIAKQVALPAGTAGTVTTRTDDNTGVCTLEAGHGLTTNDYVDVHWSGGVRHGMVATVATNAITVDGGAGDVLPALTTEVVVTKQVDIDAVFEGDDLALLVMHCDQNAGVDLQDGTDASLFPTNLTANEPWSWASDTGVTNPVAGDSVASIQASNGTTTAATLTIQVLHDTTP